MELYLIRHGQSYNNALTDPQNRVCDPPLTEIGRQQADLAAEYFEKRKAISSQPEGPLAHQNRHGYNFTQLYCSPMTRALETAQPIGPAVGLTPHIWIELHEQGGIFLDHNDGRGPIGYSGITREEIVERFPGYQIPDSITSEGWWNRPIETEPEWVARATVVADQLWDRFGGTDERVALVSHGGLITNLLRKLMDTNLPVAFGHQNTSLTRVDLIGDSQVVLRYLNRTDHLPVEAVT